MPERTAWTSPHVYARICGVLYLYIFVAGSFAEMFVRSRLVVPTDAAATARNITANESLFRLGFSGELLHLALDVAVAVLLFALLRPVGRHLALLAAFARVACDLVLAVASLGHFAALRLLSGADVLAAFSAEQLHALALLAMRLHGDGYAISLVFFGFACLALGVLVVRSTFLPRLLGALLLVAGACYLVNSFAYFLSPRLAATLFPAILVPAFVAELSLTLWLIVKGVDAARWEKKRAVAAESS
jgi:hypothetical protein